MKVLRFTAVAALVLAVSCSAADAKSKRSKECHADPVEPTLSPSVTSPAVPLTKGPAVTPPPDTTEATKTPTPSSPTTTPTPDATAASEATLTPKPSKSKTSGLKLKLYKKADLDGKKLVVKTQCDVCYSISTCFDDLTTSLAWSKIPGDVKSIELFESTRCMAGSVTIGNLGAVGGSGNVTSLKDLKFNNKVSSFVVHSVSGNGVVASHEDGCNEEDGDADEDETVVPATAAPATTISVPTTPVPTTPVPSVATTPSPTTTAPPTTTTATPVGTTPTPSTTAPISTTAKPSTKGLKVKLFKKQDLDGDKVVVPTQHDVCYSVDGCFDDLTSSLSWTKITSDALAIELFDAARCSGSSVSITTLGAVGGGGNVTSLKDYKFNKKLSSFVVRSKTGATVIVNQEDGCTANDDA